MVTNEEIMRKWQLPKDWQLPKNAGQSRIIEALEGSKSR
jgi:hypothetical protein